MKTHLSSNLIQDYLKRLDRATRDIPPTRRRELREEIQQHVAEAVPGDATEAAVRTALDRLGSPEQIAAAERERLGTVHARAGWVEAAAMLLLLIGSSVLLLIGGTWLAVLGWVAGVVLLWRSRVWSPRDKLLGTFVIPFGLLPAFLLATVPTQVCVSGGSSPASTCSGANGIARIGLIVLFAVLLVLPIYTTVHLARSAWRSED